MWIYLEGSSKGIPQNHYVLANPGQHVGVKAVIADLTEQDADGHTVGKPYTVHFINGKADVPDAVGEYLLRDGQALKEPWKPPPGDAGGDPLWRWRPDAHT
jgi:hypothetical protein